MVFGLDDLIRGSGDFANCRDSAVVYSKIAAIDRKPETIQDGVIINHQIVYPFLLSETVVEEYD